MRQTVRIASRHIPVLVFCALLLVPFRAPVWTLVNLSLADDRYSQLVFVPVISAALLCLDQRNLLRRYERSPKRGIALLSLAILLQFGAAPFVPSSAALTVSILALVLAWAAVFLIFYGARALRDARFPFLFLLLMVPLPVVVIQKISFALQVGSSELSYALFQLLGIPVYRHGFMFFLPDTVIEISEECSGVRSTFALVITALLIAHFFLRSGWRKLALVVITALLSVFKNAARIVVLSCAGTYFGVDLMNNALHHTYGGTVFSALALAILAPVLVLLRRSERAAAPPTRRMESFSCRTAQ